jgi:16S rRNA processing protein RimM
VERSLYSIGRIAKAIGVRGEVVVNQVTSASRFRNLHSVLVGPDDHRVDSRAIEKIIPGPRGIRVKFGGVNSRNDAEALIGQFLFVRRSERVKLRQNSFFVDDIVGLKVIDEDGKALGEVREVLKMPAQDIYVVARATGNMMVPAVREFIRKVDLAAGTLTVRLIEGMDEV